jgi:hypothetical protein
VATGLRGPIGIAFDRAGRALVAEEDSGQIVHVDPRGRRTVVASGLDRPRWIAVGDDDTVYVSARRATHEPGEDDTARSGVILALRLAERPALFLHGLCDPEGLAIHNGVLHVATRGRAPGHEDPILRVALGGGGDTSELADSAIRKPVGIAIDAGGIVFVTAARLTLSDDHVPGVVAKLEPNTAAEMFAGGADDAQGLAFDRDGHLYLVERKAGRVVRFLAPSPPSVDPVPEWTHSTSLALSGRAEVEARVEVVSGEITSHVLAGDDGRFAVPIVLTPNALNRLDVRAVGHDGAGLTSSRVALTMVHDGAAPALTLESPPPGATVRDVVSIRATATDPGSALEAIDVLVDGHVIPSATAPPLPAVEATVAAAWNSAAAGNGVHTLTARAVDRAGNVTTVTRSVTVDNTPPAGADIRVTIVEPPAGALVPVGPLVVRGTLDTSADDLGVTVNGVVGWLAGTAFTALVDMDPAASAIVASATTADGRIGSASIPITIAETVPVTLGASPWSGVAPLTVRFSLSRDPHTVRVELDARGDGALDFEGEALDDVAVVYTAPGIYVARVTLIDATGARTTTSAVVRVFDQGTLDGLLRAKWSAMRDALRRGDIAAGVSHIVARRRADYDAAFRLLTTSLPAIDSILTDLTPVHVRNAAAVYEMRRTDDGLLKSFQVRFAIDGDGVWRLEAF